MSLYLKITSIMSQKSLNKLARDKIISKELSKLPAVFTDYSEFNIPLNHNFKYLINKKTQDTFEINCTIQFITQAQGLQFDQIPKGHKTLCFLNINKINFSILSKILPITDGWEFSLDEIYLTDNPQL